MVEARYLVIVLMLAGLSGRSPQGLAGIGGSVFDIENDAPVAGAVVEITGVITGISSRPNTVLTGEDGKFLFQNLPPGQGYRITAHHSGYSEARYGQQMMNSEGIPISLSTGQQLTEIALPMAKVGTLQGRVLDHQNKGIESISVELVRPQYLNGERLLPDFTSKSEFHVLTDRNGEYVIPGVPSGQFYLSAYPNAAMTRIQASRILKDPCNEPPLRPASEGALGVGVDQLISPSQIYLSTYFPGTIDPKLAMPLNLHAGQIFHVPDFSVAPLSVKRVHGEVFERDSGRPAKSGQVTISPVNTALDRIGSCRVQISSGMFNIPFLAEGDYVLTAVVGGTDLMVSGSAFLRMAGADIKNLRIAVTPQQSLSGQIVMERISSNGTGDFVKFTVGLKDALYSSRVSPIVAVASADGSLHWDGIKSGAYRVTVGIPDQFPMVYVQSISIGSRPLSNGVVNISEPASDVLRVSLRDDGGTVAGHVTGGFGRWMADAIVVLVPRQESPARELLYKVSRPDSSGAFRFEGVAPESYEMFAWSNVVNQSWLDAEFTKLFTDCGIKIEVQAGRVENRNIELCSPWH